jgi:general secretion pathway protein D
LIGGLFRSSSNTNGQTELMVFLTPRIVRNGAQAQRVREDETKKLSKESQDNLKKHIPPQNGGGGGGK